MSAVAGIFDLQRSQVRTDEREIALMLSAMSGRGPDGQRFTKPASGVVLGHCRLATIDASPESSQPFQSEDGRYTVTFDGAIVNYVELRQELEQLGRHFRTASDMEVLLQAYLAWGTEALTRFNGIWAFAIHDREEDTLFCARDRIGVKSFKYVVHGGRFLFATEARALLAVEPSLAEPDYDYLSRLVRASIGPRDAGTSFRRIKNLRAAHYVVVTRAGMQTPQRYWSIGPEVDSMTLDEAVGSVRELLTDAVRLSMRGDFATCVSLSSGLDSSAVAAIVRRLYDGEVHTFTSSNPGEPDDEAPAAAELARSLGMIPHSISVDTRSFLPTLRDVVRCIEAPTHTPALFPLWYMVSEARRHGRIFLDGSGADGILAGSKANFHEIVIAHLRRGNLRAAASELAWAIRSGGPVEPILRALREVNPPFLHRLYRKMRGDEAVYIGPLRNAPELPETSQREFTHHDRLNALLVYRLERIRDLLYYTDFLSQWHGLEARFPYLDHRLIEYCMRIPGLLKYDQGYGKVVLRRAMEGYLPDSLLKSRTKRGFPTPITRWFREQPEITVFPVLRSRACRDRGIFSPRHVDWALERHISGKADLSSNIYRWIVTELWFQEFIDKLPEGSSADPVCGPAAALT